MLIQEHVVLGEITLTGVEVLTEWADWPLTKELLSVRTSCEEENINGWNKNGKFSLTGCLHTLWTHICVQTPYKSEFCIETTLKMYQWHYIRYKIWKQCCIYRKESDFTFKHFTIFHLSTPKHRILKVNCGQWLHDV